MLYTLIYLVLCVPTFYDAQFSIGALPIDNMISTLMQIYSLEKNQMKNMANVPWACYLLFFLLLSFLSFCVWDLMIKILQLTVFRY